MSEEPIIEASSAANPFPWPDYEKAIPPGEGGPRVEHRQSPVIFQLAKGDARNITRDIIDPRNKTPNQKWLAAAIHLAGARLRPKDLDKHAAYKQTVELFETMAKVGHQATGPNYGDEQGCPDPHSSLWAQAMWTILREGDLQMHGGIMDAALSYHAAHHAMCGAFWTPNGVRLPCSRAKHFPGQDLRPNWTLDSRIYSDLSGEPVITLKGAKPDMDTVRLARAESALWPEIVRRSRRAATKLFVPLRKWYTTSPDEHRGYLAALDHDVPMNDRLSWLVVDGAGNILGASNTMADLGMPDREPDLVFG